MTEYPGGITNRLLPLDGRERDDLGDVIGAVLLGGVADHLAAIPLVEVHVDVGHLTAARVEEPLEDQPVLQRVEVGDTEAVGDDRTGGTPPSRTDADPLLTGVSDEVPDDQEVGRESHLVDDPQLVIDSLPCLIRKRVSVAAAGTLLDQFPQVGALGVTLRHRENRQEDLAELQFHIGAFRHPQRIGDGTGETLLGKQCPHLVGGLHIQAGPIESKPVGVVQHRSGLNTEQHVVCRRVGRSDVVRIIGGEEWSIDPGSDLDQVRKDPLLCFDSVVAEFDEEVVATEDVLVHRRRLDCSIEVARHLPVAFLTRGIGRQKARHMAAQTAGGGDDPLGVAAEKIQIHPRFVVVPLEVGPADELHQIAVSGLVLRQQGHVVPNVLGPRRPVETTSRRHICFDADDGFDPDGRRRFVEVDDAVHHAVIGDGDRRLPVCLHRLHEVGDPSSSVEHRELGVNMKVGEAIAGHESELHR